MCRTLYHNSLPTASIVMKNVPPSDLLYSANITVALYIINSVQIPGSISRRYLTIIGNPIVEIRRSYDRLFSTMGFPILVRWYLYIESGPWINATIYNILSTDKTPERHACFEGWLCWLFSIDKKSLYWRIVYFIKETSKQLQQTSKIFMK